MAVHLGVAILNVVRHIGRLLDGCRSSCPAELLNDGDLVMLTDRVLELRRRGTVRVTKVKGHVDAEMVRLGQVRELDKLGNDAADEAADFGRRRVDPAVVDARRNLSGVCRRWYSILDVHRFFIAISRAVVNNDDREGTAVRDHAMLPGPAVTWTSDWVSMLPVVSAADDFCAWQYSVGILVKLVAFLSTTLHWPVSYGELLLMCEPWAFERLVKNLFLCIVGQVAQFQCRLFLMFQALIFGDRVDSLELSCGHCVLCLVVLAGLFHARSVPIIAS